MSLPELTWDELAGRLAPPRDYWIACTDPSGAPHASPVWGVVGSGAFHFFTGRSTVKARGLAADPRIVVHLPDPREVTIVHGAAVDLGHPTRTPHVLRLFVAKYHDPADVPFLPLDPNDPDYVLFRVDARRGFTWSLDAFDDTQRRWPHPVP